MSSPIESIRGRIPASLHIFHAHVVIVFWYRRVPFSLCRLNFPGTMKVLFARSASLPLGAIFRWSRRLRTLFWHAFFTIFSLLRLRSDRLISPSPQPLFVRAGSNLIHRTAPTASCVSYEGQFYSLFMVHNYVLRSNSELARSNSILWLFFCLSL